MYSESAQLLKDKVEEISNNTVKSFSRLIVDKNTPRSYLRNSLQAIWNIADIVQKTHFPTSLEKDLAEWFECLEEGTGVLKINEHTLELGKAFLTFITTILATRLSALPFFGELRKLQTELNGRITTYEENKPKEARNPTLEKVNVADHKTPESSLRLRLTPESSNPELIAAQPHELHPPEEHRIRLEALIERAEIRRKLLKEKKFNLVNYKAMLKKTPREYPDADNLLKCLESYPTHEAIKAFKQQYEAYKAQAPKKENAITKKLHKNKDPFLKQLKIDIKGKIASIELELEITDIAKPIPKKIQKGLLKNTTLPYTTPGVETLLDLQGQYQSYQNIQSLEREKQLREQFLAREKYLANFRRMIDEMEVAENRFNQLQQAFSTKLENIQSLNHPLVLETLAKIISELDEEVLAIKAVLKDFQTKLINISQPSNFSIPTELSEKVLMFQTELHGMNQKQQLSESILNSQLKVNFSLLQKQKMEQDLNAYGNDIRRSWRKEFFGETSGEKIDKGRFGAYIAEQRSHCFFSRQDGQKREAYLKGLRTSMDNFANDASQLNELKAKIDEGMQFKSRTFFGGREKSLKHQLEALQTVVKGFEPKAPGL